MACQEQVRKEAFASRKTRQVCYIVCLSLTLPLLQAVFRGVYYKVYIAEFAALSLELMRIAVVCWTPHIVHHLPSWRSSRPL